MKSSIDMTLGELLLESLWVYGKLFVMWIVIVVPIWLALSNAYETIFAVREGDPDDDAEAGPVKTKPEPTRIQDNKKLLAHMAAIERERKLQADKELLVEELLANDSLSTSTRLEIMELVRLRRESNTSS